MSRTFTTNVSSAFAAAGRVARVWLNTGRRRSDEPQLSAGCRHLHPHRREPAVELQPAQRAQGHGRPPGQRQQYTQRSPGPTLHAEGVRTVAV